MARICDVLALPVELVRFLRLLTSLDSADNFRESANVSTTARGSLTAEWTAKLRMLGHDLGFGPDCYASALCDASVVGPMLTSSGRIRAWYHWLGILPRGYTRHHPELISLMHARTCFFDDVLEQFVERHPTCSVVILGAGFDTRFYRLPSLRSAAVARFEVDAAGAQRKKLERLAAAGIDHSGVTFVPCDFQSNAAAGIPEPPAEGAAARAETGAAMARPPVPLAWLRDLAAAGLRRDMPAIILWEGVTMYLPEHVVEATLATIAGRFGAPAVITFDYLTSKGASPSTKGLMSRLGEPLLFSIDAHDVDAFVGKAGLHVMDHPRLATLWDRYVPAGVSLPPLEATETAGFVVAANGSGAHP